MANRNLFSSSKTPATPKTNAVNEAGGAAYQFGPEHALAQLAVTGCLQNVYYATAQDQLAKVLELADQVLPDYLARVAVYAREKGLMKDMPALLLAVLSTKDIELTKRIFPRVCDDAKMVKNFVQIIRSGQVGRKSLGTALKRLVQEWLNTRTDDQLLNAMVGSDPSLADVIKLVHPKPANESRAMLYKYLIGKDLTKAEFRKLPAKVRAFEDFKKDPTGEPPEVPFMMLTNLELSDEQYLSIADNMSWAALRQNLNALSKRGVFKDNALTKLIADKLGDAGLVKKAKAMPFQLFAAYNATQANAAVPAKVRSAIQDALEVSLGNVPDLGNLQAFVAIDISGSMSSPVTGQNGTATSSVTCLDAAAVMGSALLRRNPDNVRIIPFSDNVVLPGVASSRYSMYAVADKRNMVFNGRDSVITNVQKLRSLPSGGTNCGSVLKHLNATKATGDVVIYVSDNMSWVETITKQVSSQTTGMMYEWAIFKKRNPNAKLVCIDIQPYTTTQAQERPDILNVGGFTDSVFTVVDMFLNNQLTAEHWCGIIKEVKL